MLQALLREARIRKTIWQRRLATYRLLHAQDSLPFLVMLGVPVLCIAGIIIFAYVGGPRITPVDTNALKREVARANRRENDLQCLAENIYFEARGEPLEGQYAVAEVTLNRTQAQHFPHTVCAVVHEMRWDPSRKRTVADFSWTELGGLSPQDGPAWKRAMTVATAVYDDVHDPIAPGALFYHSTKVRPGWARTRTAIATIGNHIFYR
ncbi:MAG: N-acetylmuramoyl-L-alanine amidase [Gammaproteobacteria bacterium]|jgi:spore germination cell wall hydrolase CwlJ-like protein|nr:N-acetylmuramoyl-L-alanine amidase [Gammaproteobacteria bacterium]